MNGTFHLDDDALTLRYYGELSALEARAADAHIAECDACRAQADGLAEFLDAVPDPADGAGEPDWHAFEEQTRKALRNERWRRTLVALPRAAGWLVGVVGIGVAFGMFWSRTHPGATADGARPVDAGPAIPPSEAVAVKEPVQPVVHYLDSSRELLTDVFQTPVSCALDQHDLSSEVEMTQTLLANQASMRSHLAPLPARYGTLVADVDGALRTLNELGPCASPAQLESLRHRLQEEQLIARMALSVEELRAMEPAVENTAGGNGGEHEAP